MSVNRNLIPTLLALILMSCASVHIQDEVGISSEVKADSYAQNKDKSGVVLFDARWGRQWQCGKYENAQLISFSFDKTPLSTKLDDSPADLTIGTTSLIAVSKKFESYALLVPAGEYALSNFKIKTAKSVSNVGYWIASRSHLIKDGKPLGGKFSVAPGETVYIGNFALDCYYENPTLWRYHAQGQNGFEKQLSDYKAKYPFLDLTNVKFRLLETNTIGRPYELK
jgi:hypothetical protein